MRLMCSASIMVMFRFFQDLSRDFLTTSAAEQPLEGFAQSGQAGNARRTRLILLRRRALGVRLTGRWVDSTGSA